MITLEKSALVSGLEVMVQILLLFECSLRLAPSCYTGGSLEGTKLYVTLFPCNECAKAIIQVGIAELVYADDKYNGTPANLASRRMLTSAGVKMTPYRSNGRILELKV